MLNLTDWLYRLHIHQVLYPVSWVVTAVCLDTPASLAIGFFEIVNFAECVPKAAGDSFAYMERGDSLCILLIKRFVIILLPLLFKRRDGLMYVL